MTKIRILIFLFTILVVGSFTTLLFLYAKGFRLNPSTMQVSSSGLFVIKSYPDGAQVFINGELKTATNATLSLPPQAYDVSVKKEGYLEWKKRIEVKEGEVVEASAHLFKIAPSLTAITFSGVINPLPSPDLTKIAYIVPNEGNPETSGLWIMETINLPIGFAREPRRITDGKLQDSKFIWSPDARQILLKTSKGSFILDTRIFTPQSKLVNVSVSEKDILANWEEERKKRLSSQIKKLPEEMQNILNKKASKIVFSPDEDLVLYTASESATIPQNLIKPVPGASTQKQERDIKAGKTYIYDIKEDRNFFITEKEVILNGWVEYANFQNPKTKEKTLEESISWYPSSRHLITTEKEKIIIMDYDGTNRQTVYSGSYVSQHAYPILSLDRILILTNLGANSSIPNLYSLGIK